MRPFVLNCVIAAIWLFLSPNRSLGDLAAGFAAGFGLLGLFSVILQDASYPRRGLALLSFVARFAAQFVVANLSMAATVLARRKASLQPDFVTYDVTGLTHTEVLFLSYAITLTPGTTTVHVSEDWRTLTLHVIDVTDAAAVCREIDKTLKEPLLRVTR